MFKSIENYLLEEVIGTGSYGKVYRAVDKTTKEVVAIKIMNKEKLIEVPKLQSFIKNETQILSSISHKNIIKFHRLLHSTHNIYFIYEYCANGTLEQYIKRSPRGILSEKEALKIFNQIVSAFMVLVKENVLHRDLKPSNILIHSNGEIKIADFGFCKSLLNENDMTKTMVGSPVYMAPEILKGQQYTIKADIWSMGVCLFEMLFGYCPFEARNIAQLISKINYNPVTIPKHLNKISAKVEGLLKRMLVVDSKKRIEWVELWQEVANSTSTFEEHSKPLKPQQFNLENELQNRKSELQALLIQKKKNSQFGRTHNSNNNNHSISSNNFKKNFSQNNLNYYNNKKQLNLPNMINFDKTVDKNIKTEAQQTFFIENKENKSPVERLGKRKIASPNIPIHNPYRNASIYNNFVDDLFEKNKKQNHHPFQQQTQIDSRYCFYKNYLTKAKFL